MAVVLVVRQQVADINIVVGAVGVVGEEGVFGRLGVGVVEGVVEDGVWVGWRFGEECIVVEVDVDHVTHALKCSIILWIQI